MPTIDIKDWNNKKVGSVELPDEIFAYPYKEHLIHEAVRNYLAALRQGTHKTKTRSEVSGSGKKPFRQKGTGRARQGGARPPIHRHGGTVFGPVPRDYSYKMNAKEKKNALKSALSQRVKEGNFVLLSDLSIDEPKTKSFAEKVAKIGVEGKALIVDTFENTNAILAARNNPKLQFVDASNVNVYDVVNSRYVVLSQAALERLREVLES
ncbi:MAG TPA: 50S ribosomal protein L4 [Thermoanaerobaculia bacterium]|mgnify:CR=1 FL=1|nr:50S ribosomal protein L4 [Thermoanaerobaculia bacterium]